MEKSLLEMFVKSSEELANSKVSVAIQYIIPRQYTYPKWMFWKKGYTVYENVEHKHKVFGTWKVVGIDDPKWEFVLDNPKDGWEYQDGEGTFRRFVMRTREGTELWSGGKLSTSTLTPGSFITLDLCLVVS